MAKSGNELRQVFLDYFRQKNHQPVLSSPLVPKDDPTLLFTNAGMVQFKQCFLGLEKRDYVRAVTCQKCFRASGKHNDLENVGFTPRHHTFFEMLGNFSFGDYFKQDAVIYAWDLLTNGYGLDPERLWVSVHYQDDDAFGLWQSEVGVRPERIVRLGDADNFWAMGDTGPCGPCSEIYIDQGPEAGCGRDDCAVGCDCDRYLELWNLVFMQYNRDADGKTTPLPRPSIDTGMGLERITAVVQNKLSNYDSDLFTPILAAAGELAGIGYGSDPAMDISLRVVADHARACVFLISDGILPSNEGRGYVLRRILRRAARHGRKLGLMQPFLHKVAQPVITEMRQAYPGLQEARSLIDKIVLSEEERFGETLDTGLKILAEAVLQAKAAGSLGLDGETAFKLYDTYGFPLDLTMTIAQEEGLSVDEEAFAIAMEQQKNRSRAAWKGSGEGELSPELAGLRSTGFQTAFTGYEGLQGQAAVHMLLQDGRQTDKVLGGEEAELIAQRTPFYGESGGQVGDTGVISWPGGQALVLSTSKPGGDIVVHHIKVEQGILNLGEMVTFQVDHQQRLSTAANHTATHLLHAALRKLIGDHVKQAGSMVTPDRLRFDFSHYEGLTPPEIRAVETEVNRAIRANIPVCTTVMAMEEAIKAGAIALFEERYGSQVRLVEVNGISKELCGGTHARRTGDLGLFKIVSETSIAAGMRRIEALTGTGALNHVFSLEDELSKSAQVFKSSPQELYERSKKVMAVLKEKDREIETLKARLAGAGSRDLMSEVMDIDGVKLLVAQVEADNPKALRELSDNLRERLGSGIVVLAAKAEGKVLLLAMVSKDLVKTFHAGNIVKELAPLVGGGGGGRPDLAQAGGQDPAGLPEVLARAPEIVRAQAVQ